jgi:hypothetical protein
MITSTYSIAFDFRVDNSKLIVPLTAEVEVHHSETYYVVKNIKTEAAGKRSVLPDLTVKKENGRWVHLDSEQESHLSIQVGKSIEAIQSRQLSDTNS